MSGETRLVLVEVDVVAVVLLPTIVLLEAADKERPASERTTKGPATSVGTMAVRRSANTQKVLKSRKIPCQHRRERNERHERLFPDSPDVPALQSAPYLVEAAQLIGRLSPATAMIRGERGGLGTLLSESQPHQPRD